MPRVLTRKKFLLSAGGGVSAPAAGGAAIGGLGAMASAATAPSGEQDLRVLAFLLGVERIELAFYERAVRADALRGEVAEFAAAALTHERDPRATLEAALGTAPAPPRAPRPPPPGRPPPRCSTSAMRSPTTMPSSRRRSPSRTRASRR